MRNLNQDHGIDFKKVKELASREASVIYRRLFSQEVDEVVRQIREWAERIRVEELSKALDMLSRKPEMSKEVVEKLTERIVNRIMHKPTVAIKQLSQQDNSEEALRIVRMVFGVE